MPMECDDCLNDERKGWVTSMLKSELGSWT